MTNHGLRKGDRVQIRRDRLSEWGGRAETNWNLRCGTVNGPVRGNLVSVKWDGNKNPGTLAVAWVEKVDDAITELPWAACTG